MYNVGMDYKDRFYTWIGEKYETWRTGKYGQEGSVTRFADFLGFDQREVSAWIRKVRVPEEPEKIARLVEFYGPEVLEVMGYLPDKDIDEEYVRKWFDYLGLPPTNE